jgi:RND family efflux transporter MFP subunit
MLDNLAKQLKTILPLMLILAIAGCSGNNRETTVEDEKAISVKAMAVALTDQELTQSFTGSLEGKKQAVITSKISEAVEEILVDEGSDVGSNYILIKLDRTGPTSRYTQAYTLYVNAEKNYNKMKYLFEEGAVSETDYDASETQYKVTRADYEAAAKTVDLRTPIAGTVTSIDVSVGDYVYQGQQVATVADIDKLRLNLGVSGKDIKYFNVGDEVTARVESSQPVTGRGRVASVARSADPVTRTFQVELEIDNAEHLLRPGMFARAEILVERFEDVVVLPRDAVVSRGEKYITFALQGDRVEAREVTLGAEFNGSVQLLSGISPGDTVVTVGQDYLDDGFKVKMVRFIDAEGKETEL